jgi:hypothetical protein
MTTELGELIEQLQLDVLQNRALRSRWLDQVVRMEAKAGQVQVRYYGLRLVAIIGGVIVPALVGLNATDRTNKSVRYVTFSLASRSPSASQLRSSFTMESAGGSIGPPWRSSSAKAGSRFS